MSDIIKKPVACYYRVSTSIQAEEKTIDSQISEVHEYALKHGYEIIQEYSDEGWSGDVLERPSLDNLRLDAKKKMWEAVLIYDPDRLARRYTYQEIVMDELTERGVETLFVTVPPIKNENDQLLYEMRGSFARYERVKIAERFRMGKVNRVKNGNVLVSEAPYGLTYILNKGKRGNSDYVVGHYEVNKEEAEVLLMIFTWVADDGLTLRAVVRKLQELGISPRKSKRGVWSTSTLSTLLRNETYVGKAYWGASYAVVPEKKANDQKYRKNKKTSRKMRSEDKWYQIAVPRIIEDDLFERAGKRLKDNFALMGRNKKNDYMLAGKIWCTCGKRRTGEGPQHGKYLYYRCNDRVHSFPLPKTCHEKGINSRIADSVVWGRVEEIMHSPELMKEQIERYKKQKKDNVTSKTVIDVDGTKKEIIKLESRADKYNHAYSEGVFSLEKLREYVDPIKKQVESLKSSLAKASVENLPIMETVMSSDTDIKFFTEEAKKLSVALSFEAKKGIMSTTLDKVYSNQGGIQVYGALNLHQIYVNFFTSNRNCWATKRWEINAF